MLTRRLSSILLVLCYLPISAGAQWTSLHGPTGAFVSWLVADGGTVYFGNYDGTGGVFKTVDNGDHFTSVVSGVVFRNFVASGQNLVGAPQSPTGTAWVSHDGGQSWTKPVVIPNHSINALFLDGSTILAGTDSGVYRSIDAGSTWTPRNAGLNSRIFSLSRSGSVLLAGTYVDGVFISHDDGATWQQSNKGMADQSRTMLQVMGLGDAGAITFAVSENAIFGSTDHGANWSLYQKGLADTNGLELVADGTDAFVVTGEYGVNGIYKWSPSNNSWNAVNSGLVSPQLTFAQTGLFSAANETLTYSTDVGITWKYVNGTVVTRCGTIKMIGQSLYADRNGLIHVSPDRGVTWPREHWNHFNDSVHVIGYIGSSAIGTIGNDILLSDRLYGIRRVTPDGLHATSILAKDQFFNDGGASGLFTIGDTIFAGAGDVYDFNTSTSYSGLYVSNDAGATWNHRNNGLTDTLLTSVALDGSSIYAGTEFGKLFSSGDNGFTWDYLGRLTTTDAIVGIEARSGKIVIIAANKVYASFDNGASFVLRSEGLPIGSVSSITSDDNFFYVSTDSGVWKRAIDNLSGVRGSFDPMNSLTAYPNPAHSSTTIRYSLENAGSVSIRVMDALGRIVWSSTERTESDGLHNTDLKMVSWPVGCYEVILSSSAGARMLKMIKQ